MMPNMLHLSKFPLPRVHFEEAKFKWVSFLFLKAKCWKSCVQLFFESIQLKIIKWFIYDYLIMLIHSISSSFSSPMDSLGSSKDYFLFGRKWVDTVIGYFILFTNRLISKAMHSVLLTRAGMTSQEPQKLICFNLQQLISPPTVSRTQPNSFLHVVLLKQFVTVS